MSAIKDGYSYEAGRLAAEAELARRAGKTEIYKGLYARAAEAELAELWLISSSMPRTGSILAVSAASLWFKAGNFERAAETAREWLTHDDLPDFARAQLRELLDAIVKIAP
ncbi:MAG: hypothetical protein ACREEE_05610 [Dongiaceae bacterium]